MTNLTETEQINHRLLMHYGRVADKQAAAKLISKMTKDELTRARIAIPEQRNISIRLVERVIREEIRERLS